MPRVAMSLKTRTNDSARDCSLNRIVYACICVYVSMSVSSYVYVCVYVCVYVNIHGREATYEKESACDCSGNKSVTRHKKRSRNKNRICHLCMYSLVHIELCMCICVYVCAYAARCIVQ
jgi:hypothetical protein